ncbi:MAG: hypothetical protein ACRERD_22215 [Candidatus Binatia bacterium]
MSWHSLEKEFRDEADDIEGVNIHYAWTPLGDTPDWENQRVTRFMPPVQSSQVTGPAPTGLRKKILKLPEQISTALDGTPTARYLLHYYFEIFQDGSRHYSQLYTEEVAPGTESPLAAHEARD